MRRGGKSTILCMVCYCVVLAGPMKAWAADTGLKKVEEAYANWQKYPRYANYGAAYAHALTEAGQWTTALSAISGLLEKPDLSKAWHMILRQDAGFCFIALRRWNDAAAEFQKSLMLGAQDSATTSGYTLREARVRLDGIREWQTWTPLESKHFVFFFQPGGKSDTPQKRQSFAYIADLSYETICRSLGADLASKIYYFAYKDSASAERIFGMPLAWAESNHYQVHCTSQTPSQHEITHVITGHSCPDQMVLCAFLEGIATYFDWSEVNVHEVAAQAMDADALDRILACPGSRDLMRMKRGYHLGASFLGHLLETYPWSAVSTFCADCKVSPDIASTRAFRKPLSVLSQEWQTRVQLHANLAKEETRAQTLSSAGAEPILWQSVKADRFRLNARFLLGQLLSDQGKWKEARDVFNDAWGIIQIRGWAPSLIGQLTADLAYAEAQLGNFKQARYFNGCTVQIREPAELLTWAQGSVESLKKKELPKDPPPRVKGKKWNP